MKEKFKTEDDYNLCSKMENWIKIKKKCCPYENVYFSKLEKDVKDFSTLVHEVFSHVASQGKDGGFKITPDLLKILSQGYEIFCKNLNVEKYDLVVNEVNLHIKSYKKGEFRHPGKLFLLLRDECCMQDKDLLGDEIVKNTETLDYVDKLKKPSKHSSFTISN